MLKSKKFNIILALIAAVALWAYVLGEINPTSSTVIRNVPVNFVNEEALEAEGLTIVSVSAEAVNVTISGQRTAITRADAGDFSVTVDVEALKVGENTVRLNVTGPRSVEIERTNVEKLTIVVDKKVSVEKPVETSVTGEVAKDKELSIENQDKETAVVTGPESLVTRVEKLTAYIKVEDIGSEPKTLSVELTPADKNGVKVEGVEIEGGNKLEISAVMLSKKTVRLIVPVSNLTSSGIERQLDAPETVVIRGREEDLADVQSITCRSIGLGHITESETLTLEPILPDGVELSESYRTLTAEVTVKETVTRTFEFSESDIIFTIEALGLSYSVENADFEVTVSGRESVLENIAKSDFILSVDTEGLEAGTHSLKVIVKCEKDVSEIDITPAKAEVIIK